MISIEKRYAVLLIVVSLIVALLFAEILLRAISPHHYYVWRPNLEYIFTPSSSVMPGISGVSRFIVNESGMRGKSFSETDRYRILMVGGSTTECLYLDQSEAWPHLVQELLNDELEGSPVWVGNVGKSGLNTRHHTIQVEKLLHQYPSIDLVVLMVGVNDMLMPLRQLEGYRPFRDSGVEYYLELVNQAFAVHPLEDANNEFYKRTEIWRTLRKAKNNLISPEQELPFVQDDAGSFYIEFRNHRQNAVRIRDALPDLSAALEEYTHNLNAIIDLANKENTQVILMTQPSMWRSDLPQELANLLWFGGVGPFQEESEREYYSVDALAVAMERYNQALLRVCNERAIMCVDFASALPKDATVFYDEVHFNEPGARKVSHLLAQFLVEAGLFNAL